MTEKLLFRVLMLAMIGGLAFRLFPIVTGQPALSQFFMTEDGYLLLTVARNMAIGLGMSVSDGTIVTNGVQPLVTFLFTLPYLLTGGDKVASLIGVHLIAAGAALGGAVALRGFAARVLVRQDDNPLWPWLVAALWFTGPLLVLHTMNGLETGLYTLMILLTLLQFARVLERGPEAGLGARLALGALCGLTFLARNDAVFLVTAVFFLWGFQEWLGQRMRFVEVLGRVVPAGLVSLVIAAPWLIHNKLRFGSIVPISGSAQSVNAEFGQNAVLLPSKFFEDLFPMLPIPESIERSAPVVAVTTVVVLAVLGWFLFRCWRRGGRIRVVVAAYVLHGLALSAYYGLTFGAAHFLGRYMAPLAPLMILAAVSVLLDIAYALGGPRRGDDLAAGAGLAALLLSALLLVRLVLPGNHVHEHFQVVNWVERNVPETTWVGAVQTGTLGYWHDRTINLDGKVNPAALAAREQSGDVLDYVVASDIDYLADWPGILQFTQRGNAAFDDAFEVVVNDPAARLGVLKRRALRDMP